VNVLKVSCEAPEELLNTSAYGAGALIHVERATASAGTYAEVGTIPIVSGTYLYTYYDQSALEGSWYRTYYRDAGALRPASEYSDVTQASSYLTNYCSLYDVKQALGLLPTSTADDEELLQHIDETAGRIEAYTHRALYPDPVTLYTFDGYDALANGRLLPVPRGVVSLSLVRYANQTGGTFTSLASDAYVLRPADAGRPPGWPANQVWLTGTSGVSAFPGGYGNIELTGVFGWPSVPREIAALARRATIAAWRARSSGGGDTVTIGVMGERTYENQFSYSDRKLLESFDAYFMLAA
jgi:hypothetical protein